MTWEWKVIKEDTYKLVEYYPDMESWVEVWEADTLEELEKKITDEFVHQIIAIRKFNENMPDM